MFRSKKSKQKRQQQKEQDQQGTGVTGRWTPEEHELFLKGMQIHGRSWCKVAQIVGTRTTVQVRSHGQKYEMKMEKRKRLAATSSSGAATMVSTKSSTTASAATSRGVARRRAGGTSRGRGGATPVAMTFTSSTVNHADPGDVSGMVSPTHHGPHGAFPVAFDPRSTPASSSAGLDSHDVSMSGSRTPNDLVRFLDDPAASHGMGVGGGGLIMETPTMQVTGGTHPTVDKNSMVDDTAVDPYGEFDWSYDDIMMQSNPFEEPQHDVSDPTAFEMAVDEDAAFFDQQALDLMNGDLGAFDPHDLSGGMMMNMW